MTDKKILNIDINSDGSENINEKSKDDIKNKLENNIDTDKVVNLLHDPEFLLKLNKINTTSEIINIFYENNICFNKKNLKILDNICDKYIQEGMRMINNEDFLQNISAGTGKIMNELILQKNVLENIKFIISDINKMKKWKILKLKFVFSVVFQ